MPLPAIRKPQKRGHRKRCQCASCQSIDWKKLRSHHMAAVPKPALPERTYFFGRYPELSLQGLPINSTGNQELKTLRFVHYVGKCDRCGLFHVWCATCDTVSCQFLTTRKMIMVINVDATSLVLARFDRGGRKTKKVGRTSCCSWNRTGNYRRSTKPLTSNQFNTRWRRFESFWGFLHWHSQTVTTFQPSFLMALTLRRSLATFFSNLSAQKDTRVFGIVAFEQDTWRCQKHPWTKITLLRSGKTISGVPGNDLL